MEFRDGEVVVDKPLNDLDELLVGVGSVLDENGVGHAVVGGYVAVLFGRSRATEDIDLLCEPFDRETADAVADGLRRAGYWGSAMPLDDLYETLADGVPVRIAEDGHRVPNVELKFASDEDDRISLHERVTVRLGSETIHVGSLEFQIAYKLSMGAQKDFEDALHLHGTAGPNLNRRALQRYVERLGVGEEYDRLRGP